MRRAILFALLLALLLASVAINIYLAGSLGVERRMHEKNVATWACAVAGVRAEHDLATDGPRLYRHASGGEHRFSGEHDGPFAIWEGDALSNKSGRRTLSPREHEIKVIFGTTHIATYNHVMREAVARDEGAPRK